MDLKGIFVVFKRMGKYNGFGSSPVHNKILYEKSKK